ncbi:MAG TPA: hypothetical protein VJL32_02900, partial [Candidatus Paceibacterota bacterium]
MSHNSKFRKFALVAILAQMVLFAAVARAQNQDVTIKPGESWTGSIPKSSTLSLEGRIIYSKPAGANYVLQISVNGNTVTSPLTNKGQSFQYKDGRTFDYKLGSSWLLFYGPDYSSDNSSAGGGYQVMTDPGQAYHYSWNISSLIGSNPLMDVVIKNVGATYPITGRLSSGPAVTANFPIKELGSCENQTACKAYCNKKENISSCVSYAEKNGMISAEDASKAREFSDALAG